MFMFVIYELAEGVVVEEDIAFVSDIDRIVQRRETLWADMAVLQERIHHHEPAVPIQLLTSHD